MEYLVTSETGGLELRLQDKCRAARYFDIHRKLRDARNASVIGRWGCVSTRLHREYEGALSALGSVHAMKVAA